MDNSHDSSKDQHGQNVSRASIRTSKNNSNPEKEEDKEVEGFDSKLRCDNQPNKNSLVLNESHENLTFYNSHDTQFYCQFHDCIAQGVLQNSNITRTPLVEDENSLNYVPNPSERSTAAQTNPILERLNETQALIKQGQQNQSNMSFRKRDSESQEIKATDLMNESIEQQTKYHSFSNQHSNGKSEANTNDTSQKRGSIGPFQTKKEYESPKVLIKKISQPSKQINQSLSPDDNSLLSMKNYYDPSEISFHRGIQSSKGFLQSVDSKKTSAFQIITNSLQNHNEYDNSLKNYNFENNDDDRFGFVVYQLQKQNNQKPFKIDGSSIKPLKNTEKKLNNETTEIELKQICEELSESFKPTQSKSPQNLDKKQTSLKQNQKQDKQQSKSTFICLQCQQKFSNMKLMKVYDEFVYCKQCYKVRKNKGQIEENLKKQKPQKDLNKTIEEKVKLQKKSEKVENETKPEKSIQKQVIPQQKVSKVEINKDEDEFEDEGFESLDPDEEIKAMLNWRD